jgi:hypothetical protein
MKRSPLSIRKRMAGMKVRHLLLLALWCTGPGSARAASPQDTIKTAFTVFRDTLPNGKALYAELPAGRAPNDFTPIGFVRQPSFVRGAGVLNKKEHALLLYMDADVLPPALMAGYRYGLVYWWNIGADIGGDAGVFQSTVRTRIENVKLRKTESFFWSNEFAAGFKYHRFDFGKKARFDDRSCIVTVDNSFAWRFTPDRSKSVYLSTLFYMDYDLHTPHRQTDYYLMPAIIGYETMLSNYTNFFVEVTAAYSINGMELGDGTILYEKSWFPSLRLGIALRSGKRTAVYYTRETRKLSRGK